MAHLSHHHRHHHWGQSSPFHSKLLKKTFTFFGKIHIKKVPLNVYIYYILCHLLLIYFHKNEWPRIWEGREIRPYQFRSPRNFSVRTCVLFRTMVRLMLVVHEDSWNLPTHVHTNRKSNKYLDSLWQMALTTLTLCALTGGLSFQGLVSGAFQPYPRPFLLDNSIIHRQGRLCVKAMTKTWRTTPAELLQNCLLPSWRKVRPRLRLQKQINLYEITLTLGLFTLSSLSWKSSEREKKSRLKSKVEAGFRVS